MLFRKNKLVTLLFAILTILYIWQTVATAPDPSTLHRYHISAGAARWLTLTIALPYIIIWLVSLIGYLRLKSYQTFIKASKDGEAFRYIARGVLWLGLFLPISSLLSGLANSHVRIHHGAVNPVRISNYLALLILFYAVWEIYLGSWRLLSFIKSKDIVSYSRVSRTVSITYIAFSAIYTLLVLHDPTRQVPSHGVTVAGYYEPDWLLMLTIVVPRLITWYLGLLAVMNIYIYRQKVNGTLYRDALKNLAFGIAAALISIVVLRVVQTLSVWLTRASLGSLLIIIYVLLILISIGYIYIARGAKKLQKLEEI